MMNITSTPWGRPITQHQLAAGIISVSCEGHGGILVTPERYATMPEALRQDGMGPDGCWFEEDVEWHLVALAFPDAFTPVSVWNAVRFIRAGNLYPKATAYVNSDEGADLRERHKRFVEENGHLYTAGCMSSSGNGWTVHFQRISDGRCATAINLTSDEAFVREPIDITIFGDRVKFDA